MSTNSLTTALEIFLLDCRARNLADETLKFYQERVEHFLAFVGDSDTADLSEMSTTVIRRYFVELQDAGWKSTRVHAAARALKAFFNFCADEELLDKSPMRKLRLPKPDNEVKPSFEVDDIQRLLTKACTQRDRAIVLCLLDAA